MSGLIVAHYGTIYRRVRAQSLNIVKSLLKGTPTDGTDWLTAPEIWMTAPSRAFLCKAEPQPVHSNPAPISKKSSKKKPWGTCVHYSTWASSMLGQDEHENLCNRKDRTVALLNADQVIPRQSQLRVWRIIFFFFCVCSFQLMVNETPDNYRSGSETETTNTYDMEPIDLGSMLHTTLKMLHFFI